tara:strand:+ start:269 stop:718 length:450 start_codon:yes stop_codon:yes gene_type:complete
MKYDLDIIKKELKSLPNYDTQLYLQGDTPDMDANEPIKNYLLVDETENDFNVPLFDIPYINSILKENNLVRTRIMKMKPKTCYYWHHDKTKRLHIPIETHEHCFLLLDNDRIHLPADGTAYEVDTTVNHTALNCSKIDRIHIVGVIKNV